MLRLFKRSPQEATKTLEQLQQESERLEQTILQKRKDLKYLEAPLEERHHILNAKQQQLEDLIDEYGEKKLALQKREELLAFKEKVLREKENNFIQKTL